MRTEIKKSLDEVRFIQNSAQATIDETEKALEENYRKATTEYIGQMVIAKIEATYLNNYSIKDAKLAPRVARLA